MTPRSILLKKWTISIIPIEAVAILVTLFLFQQTIHLGAKTFFSINHSLRLHWFSQKRRDKLLPKKNRNQIMWNYRVGKSPVRKSVWAPPQTICFKLWSPKADGKIGLGLHWDSKLPNPNLPKSPLPQTAANLLPLLSTSSKSSCLPLSIETHLDWEANRAFLFTKCDKTAIVFMQEWVLNIFIVPKLRRTHQDHVNPKNFYSRLYISSFIGGGSKYRVWKFGRSGGIVELMDRNRAT